MVGCVAAPSLARKHCGPRLPSPGSPAFIAITYIPRTCVALGSADNDTSATPPPPFWKRGRWGEGHRIVRGSPGLPGLDPARTHMSRIQRYGGGNPVLHWRVVVVVVVVVVCGRVAVMGP